MISSILSAISYSGNDSPSAPYAIPFPLMEASHLLATVTDSDGVTTAYSGTLNVVPERDSYGRITSASVTTSTAVAVASTIRFYRDTPALQPLDLAAGGTLPPEATESALDRVVMIAQEARRDAAYSGTPEISMAGTGLVAQVAADSFTARTISPASGSPLAVTNGSGVDGNPTIALDFTGLTADAAFDADAQFLTKTADGFQPITGTLLKAGLRETVYKTITLPASEITPATSGGCTVGADTGLTVRTVTAQFLGATASKGYFRFFVPSDYAGGTIKIRFHYIGHTTATFIVSNAVFNIKHNRQNAGFDGSATTFDWDATATATKYTQSTAGLNSAIVMGILGSPISLGDTYDFGDAVMVEISRDPTDALDQSTPGSDERKAAIAAITIQYAASPAVSPWS